MELADVLARGGEGRVIVVDDYYARPSLAVVGDDAYTALYHHLDGDAVARAAVCTAVGLAAGESLESIMAGVEREINTLWDRYADGSLKDALGPLFVPVEEARAGSQMALSAIEKFARDELNTEPLTFGSLEDAKDALSNCTLAFVDFRFQASASAEQAIEVHERFADNYRARLQFEQQRCPKIVYLISSSMPSAEWLASFRKATGLRLAFFKPLRKSDVSAGFLSAEHTRWQSRFAAAGGLDAYLSAMSDAVQASATKLCQQVDEIELHDLAILRLFRLAVEHESLQSYLTWLLSEAMASKLRLAPQLQSSLVLEASMPPLDGKLKLGDTLFELFSQIAISPVELGDSRPGFGDVYVAVPVAPPAVASAVASGEPAPIAATEGAVAEGAAPATAGGLAAAGASAVPPEDARRPRKVLLVISPACDLARFSLDDVVLCIEGTQLEDKPNMEELLKAGALFGKGSHVIQYGQGADKKYAYINWDPGAFRTYPVKEMENTACFTRVARLSEMFAQEVKELAMAKASRVGIQVNPPFAVSAKVVVRCKYSGVAHDDDLSTMGFESAMVIKGRVDTKSSQDGKILGFTEQFVEWMRGTFFEAARARLPSGPPPPSWRRPSASSPTGRNSMSTWAAGRKKASSRGACRSGTCPRSTRQRLARMRWKSSSRRWACKTIDKALK